MLDEMGIDSDQLPVLQHALMRTWDYWMLQNDAKKPIKSAIQEDKEYFKQLAIDNRIAFTHYNGSRNAALEQILNNTTLDSNILKERIYKVFWNYFDNYKEDNPKGSKAINNIVFKLDNDFKIQLFSALIERYGE